MTTDTTISTNTIKANDFYLTQDNYHSGIARQLFFGASQIKDFLKCPAMAIAKINGEFKQPMTDALLQGQYVDAYFEGKTEEFKLQHPEMFSTRGATAGELKAPYKMCETAIETIETDRMMSYLCSGKQQEIYTAEIDGVWFKIMIDSLHGNNIIDRKFMRDFQEKYQSGKWCEWYEAWGYDIQGAIYTDVFEAVTKNKAVFDLVAISKQEPPAKRWLRFSAETLENARQKYMPYIKEWQAMKEGLIDAPCCGECEYCRSKAMLSKPKEV